MTPEEAAAALDGNQCREEGSIELFREMKESGLVAVFGASDDLMEFRGAIDDEVGAWEGNIAFLDTKGLIPKCDDDDCPHEERIYDRAARVEAIWCPEDESGNTIASWAYKTDIPHATFTIMEDDDVYCHGIVFRLAGATAKE